MNALALPALDGRKALGFLAALGLTRLLEIYDGNTPRLAWTRDTSTAVLQTRHETVEALAGRLAEIAQSIPDEGVLPGVPPALPPLGAAPDRLRVPPAELRELAGVLAPAAEFEVEAWMTSLVTDLSLDDKGRSDISLMAAPSGKQSMRTMLEKPLAELRSNSRSLHEALMGWRRYPGVTGEYLDHQVLFDAADSGAGESEERGVPGATWLALMSYPLFRTTAAGKEPITSGWHRRPGQAPTFLYPLWTVPLGCDAIVALVEHPLWEHAADGRLPTNASAFSVFAVHRFQRRRIPGRTFAGVLGPVR
jgi:hypothetical protein